MDEYNLFVNISLEKEGEITLTQMEDEKRGGERVSRVRVKRLDIPLADAGRSHKSQRLYASIIKLIAEWYVNTKPNNFFKDYKLFMVLNKMLFHENSYISCSLDLEPLWA